MAKNPAPAQTPDKARKMAPDLPTPGTHWTKTDGKAGLITNVNLNTQAIGITLEDGSRIVVKTYQWPGDWTLQPGHDAAGQPKPIRATLVGGDEGKWFLHLRDAAATLGVDLVDHIATKKKLPSSFHKDTELVVILSSHIGHKESLPMVKAAKDLKIKCVYADSKRFKTDLESEMRKLNLPIHNPAEQFGSTALDFDALLDPNRPWWEWNDQDEAWEPRRPSDYADEAPAKVSSPVEQSPDLGPVVALALTFLAGVSVLRPRR